MAGRLDGLNCSWETFCGEFTTKYFPPEAYDRLEGAFLDLLQDDKIVREYEAEFNSLKKYAGRELEDGKVQVRRFMCGMRIKLRNRCIVRNYDSVADLAEKAAMIESGMNEEVKILGEEVATQRQSGAVTGQKKKKWEKNNSSKKSTAGRSVCSTCGKMHLGTCKTASRACFRCGSLDHKARNCPEEDTRASNQGKDVGVKSCYNCNEPEHFKMQCLKLGQQSGKRPSEGLPPPPKRQALMPRVYSMGEEKSDPITSRPIIGKTYHLP